jgi:hypothetical protein
MDNHIIVNYLTKTMKKKKIRFNGKREILHWFHSRHSSPSPQLWSRQTKLRIVVPTRKVGFDYVSFLMKPEINESTNRTWLKKNPRSCSARNKRDRKPFYEKRKRTCTKGKNFSSKKEERVFRNKTKRSSRRKQRTLALNTQRRKPW